MSVLKVLTSTRKTYPLVARHSLEAVYWGRFEDKFLLKLKVEQFAFADIHQEKWKRFLHTTHSNRDMEAAFKAIGGGIAATGVIGPGIGVGYIFGSLLNSTARNPSVGNKIMTTAFVGAALCESMALFALMVSFMALM